MPAKIEAEIPSSALEYAAFFEKPILDAWSQTGRLTAAVLTALVPFGFDADHVESRTNAPKLGEYGMLFERATPAVPAVKIFVGVTKIVVTAESMDWTEAEQIIKVTGVAVQAIIEAGRTQLRLQRLGLGMHVQLKGVQRRDVTAPLVNPATLELLGTEVESSGIILNGGGANLIVDASVLWANALYVRIYRDHPGHASLPAISEALLDDEKRLFGFLGIEGVL